MDSKRLRIGINSISLVIVLVTNYLANALPLNGQSTGQVAEHFKVFFLPAGYVFSIWGLIYLALVGFAIFQALPAQRENSRLQRIGYLFALSNVANASWLFFWHYEQFIWSVVAMLILLFSLITIYIRLEIDLKQVHGGQRWLVNFPFSLYLGWICVATIANVTSTLDSLDWQGLGVAPQVWAVIMMGAAALIGGLFLFIRKDPVPPLVISWALAGIGVRQFEVSATVAWSAILFTSSLFVVVLATWGKRRGQTSTT